VTTQTIHSTKQRLLDVGLPMLLKHGYNDLGIQAVLVATGVPKGSFYHHFEDKQDFALQVIEQYMGAVHEALATALEDTSRPSLDRIRCFFEMTEESYRQQGYLGCLLGGLGQELSAANEVFRQRIDECIAEISTQLSRCLAEAKKTGDIAAAADPERLASLLVDCWEGAALRSRLRRDVAPLDAMLDFYFGAVTAGAPARRTR
jgi:TetR/AcrR family transcriptional regulator, transcriptional repressor for nem operon